MRIGEVIRKYRKEKHMTQEEMANRLGVTAPAVNKWENNVSMPDITLLAPIARLLGITLETLLSFHEELTEEEIGAFVDAVSEKLKNEPYREVFLWAKGILEQYPNCEKLIWQTALLLDVQRIAKRVENAEQYDDYILKCYTRILESSDADWKRRAADSLSAFWIRKEEYEKAEEYLIYFSAEDPARKLKQALIYSKTNRRQEAYKVYEEMLFSGVNMLDTVLGGLYSLAEEEKDVEKARFLAEKGSRLAELFEMGVYHELAYRLKAAMDDNDAGQADELMERLLENVETLGNYRYSRLYEHMTFKELSPEFLKELKRVLKEKYKEETSGNGGYGGNCI